MKLTTRVHPEVVEQKDVNQQCLVRAGHEECQMRWETTVAARWDSQEGDGAGGTQALQALPGEDSVAQCGADMYPGITCLVIGCPSFTHPYCLYVC